MYRYDRPEAETLIRRTPSCHAPYASYHAIHPSSNACCRSKPLPSSRIAAESRPRTPYPQRDRFPAYSLQVRSGETLHHARALLEAGPEDSVCVLEHAVLEAHHDELTALEARLDQAADVLRM